MGRLGLRRARLRARRAGPGAASLTPARPTPAELYRRAEALAPVLAGRAESCEQLRHCPSESIADMTAAGLLQICRPARFGGYEYAWDVLSKVSRILARG